MPRRSDAPPLTRSVILRGLVFAVAIGIGAVAVWLIVTSTTQKSIQIGVLVGLYGAVLGAFAIPGSRRAAHPTGTGGAGTEPGAEIELRSAAALERRADAQARREFEARLEEMLRDELHETMGRELDGLRAEIGQLRSELLEKVGGQLRLERIETTRLIGSDLEALQDEVRKLKFAKPPDEFTAEFAVLPGVGSVQRIVEHTAVSHGAEPVAPARPVEPAETRAAVAPPRQPEPEPERAPEAELPPPEAELASQPAPAPEPVAAAGFATTPAELAAEQTAPISPRAVAAAAGPPPDEASAVPDTVPDTVPDPVPDAELAAESAAEPEPFLPATPVAVSEPAPLPVELPEPIELAEPGVAPIPQVPEPVGASMFDDLASLPRLRPFTDFELDPIPSAADPAYHGRRRSHDEESAEPSGARHAAPPVRRHRRATDDDTDSGPGNHSGDGQDDLLARLLARESVR